MRAGRYLHPCLSTRVEVYQVALLSTCSTEHIRVGAAFWTYERLKGQTFPQMERKLSRLGQRFALKKTPEETLDVFVLEKLLQTLPTPAATYVRRTKPAVAFHADEEEEFPFTQWEDDLFLNQRSPPGEPWTQITHENLQRAQQQDESLKPLQQEAQRDEDSQYFIEEGLLYAHDTSDMGEDVSLIVVPDGLRRKQWETAHSAPMAGHLGKKKTVRKLTTHFWWPDLSKDVADWCRQCPARQRGNNSKRARAPLMPLPVIDQPWKRVAVDIVGPLERSHAGNKYILMIMDFSTRYPEAVPLKKTDARTVADALCQTFSRFGVPSELLSDRGSLSKVVAALLNMLKVVHIKTSAYHPQSNGMLERFHGTLKAMIHKTCPEPKDWDKWLPYLLFSFREAPHTATGFSPFELLFGRDVRGPLAIVKEQWQSKQQHPQSIIDFVQTTQQRLRHMAELARENDNRSKKASNGPKLAARWHGPYQIVERVSPVSYKLQILNRRKQIRQFHRNMLKRWVAPAVHCSGGWCGGDRHRPVATGSTGHRHYTAPNVDHWMPAR